MRRTSNSPAALLSLLLVASGLSATMAQNCISLSGSETCPAFASSSISTQSSMTGQYPFLQFVSNAKSFDDQLRRYIATDYSQQKYEQLIGCNALNLTNTTDLYARYTTSVICNALVQGSIADCKLSQEQSRPLCADSCAQMAISEQEIASSPEVCGKPGSNAIDQIRADFTNCALPAASLSGTCIEAVENEANGCGFADNIGGLCSFCAASSPNSTDSCCVNSDANNRCKGVHIPTTTSMPPLFPSSTSSGTAKPSASDDGSSGLTAGQIAGIVLGAILGALLILGLVIFGCIAWRRRRNGSKAGSMLNQPSPNRKGQPINSMTYADAPRLEVTPVGRIARMSAIEASSSASSRMGGRSLPSDTYDSPNSRRSGNAPPKRGGSLSSSSAVLGADDPTSPQSGGSGRDTFVTTSANGVTSGHSEQLQSFKDYYSPEEIRPNDAVATLWAYHPRANDEWALDRGDMLKVVGIWDDGWATGVKLTERAEEWDTKRNAQRDSGMSSVSQSNSPDTSSVAQGGEIKAFPLVCVCLPQHWRKTIESEATETGTSSGGPPAPPGPR